MTPAMTVEQEYVETRPTSRALHERALRSMPSGVAHDGRAFSPFPLAALEILKTGEVQRELN